MNHLRSAKHLSVLAYPLSITTFGLPSRSNRSVLATASAPVLRSVIRGCRIRSSMVSVMSRLAVMILIAATSVGRAQTTGQDNAAVTLAPGDQLRIAVWGHPEFSGDFLIAPD